MKTISAKKITDTVANLCVKANHVLREDVLRGIKTAYRLEKNKKAKYALGAVIKNAGIAKEEKLAICQDTGLPIVFIEIGQNVLVSGDLKAAVIKGIESGYRKGNFRESVVVNPITRGKPAYNGAVIHMDIIKGNRLKITVLPKGFGCENKSQLKMFNPTVSLREIKDFVVNAVKSIGPDACPPYIVGLGIGGTADYACLLAKKALLRKLTVHNARLATLERDLLKEINRLNIGVMGLGGKATCLVVQVESYPTHIAGLPVAVNISCHALRSASALL